MDNETKAAQLFDYMSFRAKREQQEHSLTLEFYQEQLANGIQTFFGVVVGPEGLEADMQEPQFFKEWRGGFDEQEFLCPVCDSVLIVDLPATCTCDRITEQPHLHDTDGFCPFCSTTYNIDYCRARCSDGEVLGGHLDRRGNVVCNPAQEAEDTERETYESLDFGDQPESLAAAEEPRDREAGKAEIARLQALDAASTVTFKIFCPICDGALVTDQANQDDVDGFCPACNLTFNIDVCKVQYPDGEITPAEPVY